MTRSCAFSVTALFVSSLSALAADPPYPPMPERLGALTRPPARLADDFGGYKTPLRFVDGRPVTTPEQWRKRRQEILKTWHGFMGPWPDLVARPRIEYLGKERREGVTQHHVRVETAPGRLTDDAYLLVPDGEGPFPAVLVVFYEAGTGIGRGKSPRRDFAWQLARRGFVALSLGGAPETYYPNREEARLQPLSFHAYEAANMHTLLASLPQVDARRIGVVGHSYGGKWALFASCLHEPFACAAWSDPGIVFDESRGNVNYWDRWYLGHEAGPPRPQGGPPKVARTGAYKKLVEGGHDLHELHALMAPRPLLVSGGSEDPPERWQALNHARAVNRLLGHEDRVAMSNRPTHDPTEESNELLGMFFEYWLRPATPKGRP